MSQRLDYLLSKLRFAYIPAWSSIDEVRQEYDKLTRLVNDPNGPESMKVFTRCAQLEVEALLKKVA